MRKILRTAIGTVALLEGLAFFGGAALHLGLQLPVPWVEARSFSSALLETASGVVLVIAAVATAMRPRVAWKLAVAGHVVGVASIAWGATRGSAPVGQSSHHPVMLLLLIIVLIALSLPPCRQALENGRHRSRRRRRILQAL